jgi:hypothetical protein
MRVAGNDRYACRSGAAGSGDKSAMGKEPEQFESDSQHMHVYSCTRRSAIQARASAKFDEKPPD